MTKEWTEAFYDAGKHGGSNFYVQAEISSSDDLSWVAAARDFARDKPELRRSLEANDGELKSCLYFRILESDGIRSYTSLCDRLREGPRRAKIYVYELYAFRSRGMELLDVTDKEVRKHEEVERELRKQVAIGVVRSSPIADLQARITGLGVPNYSPLVSKAYFDAEQIAAKYGHKYPHLVHVAARTQAVFGSLTEIEPDPALRAFAAREKLLELLKIDRTFDKDFPRSLIEVLIGVFDIELGLFDLGRSRLARIREVESGGVDGVQAADVAAGIARRILAKQKNSATTITAEGLQELHDTFRAVFRNGARLV